jgi:hypothetical protein
MAGSTAVLHASPGSARQPATPWSVWHNPQLKGRVQYDPGNEAIVLASGASAEAQMQDLRRLTEEDQKEIINSFISQLEALNGPQDQFNAVKGASPDQAWNTFRRALGITDRLKDWIPYRRQKLREIAVIRLKELGVAEQTARRVTEAAVSASKARKQAKLPHPQTNLQSSAQPVGRSIGDLALAVVRQMSEAEIEELRIPLGAVWKALKQRE